jgi:hypothetical protein
LDNLVSTDLPQYRCHKVVGALKIACIEYLPNNEVMLQFHDKAYGPMQFSLNNKPRPSNDWYFVVYEGGYFSFSPTKDFEDGYTLITEVS